MKERKWTIHIDKSTIVESEDNGEKKICFVGYEQGRKARKKELYFKQREQEKENFAVTFDPAPAFISYSFFAGLFGDTVKYLYNNTEKSDAPNFRSKRELTDRFLTKFRFETKNETLDKELKSYAAVLAENQFDTLNTDKARKNGYELD